MKGCAFGTVPGTARSMRAGSGSNMLVVGRLRPVARQAVRPTESRRVVVAQAQKWSQQTLLNAAKTAVASACAGIVIAAAPVGEATATDAAAVGACLLRSCQTQLAKCIGDAGCLQNLVCLQKCNGRPDESACQIRCGDLYEDEAVNTFNCCAVSDQKCVPQALTEDAFPVPSDSALDDSFDLSQFTGRWYITAGYNKLFDTFDCQEHFFDNPDPGEMYGKINWRITKPGGDFIQRSTVQKFVQDPEHPSKLYNHDNIYLHYEDDWYVAAWKPEEYAFIYYKGNNDAWRGYGGATVYTRARSFPAEYTDDMRAAAESVGLSWDDFTITDNSCSPRPPPSSLWERVVRFEASIAREFENDLESFGRGFTVLQSDLVKELTAEEKLIERELKEAGDALKKMERSYKRQPVASIGQ